MAYGISAFVMLAGIASFFHGFEQGVEFKGGRSYTVSFDKAVKNDDIRDDLENTFGDFPVIKTVGDSRTPEHHHIVHERCRQCRQRR